MISLVCHTSLGRVPSNKLKNMSHDSVSHQWVCWLVKGRDLNMMARTVEITSYVRYLDNAGSFGVQRQYAGDVYGNVKANL